MIRVAAYIVKVIFEWFLWLLLLCVTVVTIRCIIVQHSDVLGQKLGHLNA